MLTGMFMLWTVFIIWKRGFRSHAIDFRYSWKEKFQAVPKIAPFLFIIFGVMYALYGGVATPSEAAGVGAALCLILAVLIYRLWRPDKIWHILRDTMREFGPNIYPKNAIDGAANQIAAMPSLHFGWAMIEAIAVITILKSKWRWLIVLHPLLMAMSIIATGNHWWIDAAAAALIIISSVAGYRMLKLWAGDRHWSWTKMRFQTDQGLARLEDLANSSDESSDEGNTLERVD